MPLAVTYPTSSPWTAEVNGVRFNTANPIGNGGQGTVYPTPEGNAVKIRRLPKVIGALAVDGDIGPNGPDISQYDTLDLETLRPVIDGFDHEAAIMRRVGRHPNILPLYNAGVDTATYSLYHLHTPRYESSLDQDLREHGPYAPHDAVKLVRQVASALGHMHRRGVIHRDVKPGNILLDADGNAVLCDFGLAILEDQAQEPCGTPGYIAPEQMRGSATRASDGYSLAAMAYKMLTGVGVFDANEQNGMDKQVEEVMWKHLTARPQPFADRTGRPNNSPVLDAVEAVVLAELSKDARARYLTVEAFADALANAAYQSEPDRLRARQLYPEEIRRDDVEQLVAEAAKQERAGDPAAALLTLNEAHKADPDNIDVLDLTARVSASLGWREVAADAAARIVRLPARRSSDLVKLSDAYRYLGDPERAERYRQRAKAYAA